MSNMNLMDRLLDGVNVEWKRLGDVLVRTKGTKITAGKMRELHKVGAPLKIFAGGRTIAFVNYADIPANDVNKKPSIIVKSRASSNLNTTTDRSPIRMKCGLTTQKQTRSPLGTFFTF